MKIVMYDNNANATATKKMREIAEEATSNKAKVVFQNPNPFQPEMVIEDVDVVLICDHGAKQEQVSEAYKKLGIPVHFVSDEEFLQQLEKDEPPVKTVNSENNNLQEKSDNQSDEQQTVQTETTPSEPTIEPEEMPVEQTVPAPEVVEKPKRQTTRRSKKS